jgi:ABC-type lipoprotein export system ATPase subunit
VSDPVVQARNLTFSYGSAGDGPRVRVLSDVSFDIHRGDFVAIQGPSPALP